ncbi:acetyl/propionyl/methylcrotonyl-CoA carboxylase subunit alpha [Streptomyces boninensis]|uniref:acetyl/propionyl/methylcrotonyl-CoA carboxylase subunit alpha n=1 Tax=Streptomyces boninensis TaxID=2039455 RepID=UPI003B20DC60
MIQNLLVANRGEIACRVFRTCRELGIATVAVHSDADASALHVREADAAVRLPGNAPADTYLRGDLVVKAALAAGADAVHPGYGFLSENADFARAVKDAGLTWIGPPPEAIEAMASKTRAKALLGISPLDPAAVTDADLPVLVKAAAGGGGRGMRVVRELASLRAEMTAASAEAASAFGDGEVFVEPYVEDGRHVEVQILADTHDAVWALGTRDCSLQRRHQKVIEEAPAPGPLPDGLEETAVRAARAVGYVGAGTVEFLVGPDGRAQFLEMNTRLQVEHPVTELVYGVDLVAHQIRIAEGASLAAEPPVAGGHAIEARLYAEDPGGDFAPQVGEVRALFIARPAFEDEARSADTGSGAEPREGGRGAPPADSGRGGLGDITLRLDTGYAAGDTVTPHYDPLLAKFIVHAPTRPEALRKLARALDTARVHGPVTNRDLLTRSLRHPEFAAARMTTGFYDRHLADLTTPTPGGDLAALAAAIADATTPKGQGAWRNLPSQPQLKTYSDAHGTRHEIRYHRTRTGYQPVDFPGVTVVKATPTHVTLESDGVRRTYEITAYDDDTVHVNNHALRQEPRFPEAASHTAPGSLLAPMPGTVVRIADGLAQGVSVTQGQPLLWLEAMKMEHKITAPASGTLTALHAEPGRQVEVGALLAVVQESQEEETP